MGRRPLRFRVGVNKERTHIRPSREYLNGSLILLRRLVSTTATPSPIARFVPGLAAAAAAPTLDNIRRVDPAFGSGFQISIDGEKLTSDNIKVVFESVEIFL